MSRRSNPAEELLRRTAHRETFRNVAHQLQCLKRRYNVLYGVTADTASSSNHHHHPNSRAFILRKLKYALRTQYEACFPLPPPDRCTVLLLFDTNEEAFFEIRLKPKAWPEDWPTRFDCGSAGIDMELLSGAIYMKVLEAFNEEEGEEAENGTTGGLFSEPSRAFGVVSSSGRIGGSTGAGPRSSVVEENGLIRVIVKSEEEEIVIDDEEEETAEDNVHANEQVNRRASADGLFINGDQQQQQQEEDGMDYNNTLQRENLAERPREESSRRPSSSTANNSSHNNNRNNNAFNGSNNDNSNGRNSQLSFSNTVKQEPTANSNSSSLVITRMPPLEFTSSSESLQNHPLSLPPSAPVASAFSSHLLNSSRSSSEMRMIAAADRFTASSAYQSASSYDRLSCPLCEKLLQKCSLTDHINAVHLKRRRYHCAWPGCAKTFGRRGNIQMHLRQVHKSKLYKRYLQVRD